MTDRSENNKIEKQEPQKESLGSQLLNSVDYKWSAWHKFNPGLVPTAVEIVNYMRSSDLVQRLLNAPLEKGFSAVSAQDKSSLDKQLVADLRQINGFAS